MKKILWLLLAFASINTSAQKKNFTMTEAVSGMASTFAVKNLKQLQWMGNSDYYSYSISSDSVKYIYRTNANTFVSDTLLTLPTLNNALSAIKIKTLAALPGFSYLSEQKFYFQHDNHILFGDVVNKNLQIEIVAKLPADADHIMVDTNKMSVAYVSANNLFVQYKESGFVKLSNDGSSDIVYGQSVHRNEFGIDKGIFFSPKGNHIAFYRMDQSMVENYPIVNWNETPATVKNIKYPFAGRTSHQVTIGVYNCRTGNTVYLQTGEPKDQYLTTVSWSPDEKYIYVTLLNRDQNHAILNRYDAITGTFVKTLFEEKHDRYVEPQHALYFYNNNPNEFIWWSQRDGYMHLYHSVNDQPLSAITSGNWLVNEVLGYSAKANEIIFTGTKESPMQKNVYAVNLQSKVVRLISTTLATHTAQLGGNGNFLIDSYSGREIPRNIEIVNLSTQAEKRLLTASNTLGNYNTARVDDVKLYTDDKTLLYGKLMYPIDFDASKKYPAVVYLYNGPHVQLNKDAFPYSGNLWYDYMAQHGYFVFVMDGRGSSNRGFEFESAIHRQSGTLEMQDQLKGVDYLKSLPFIDVKKMGVHGWSYGGFMTTSLMLRNAGVFACGVAGGPVLDWSMYEIMYGERYMDTPEQNPEGYKNNLLFDKVKNLQGKLLLIHGADDDVVVWQHSMKLIKKSVDEGVQVDYFVYPGHPHNVRGKDRVHLMQKITDYFDANLK
ncbi:MAG: DPP IV N-terminal domain-containing protein [Bacteroidetes bacterium]|nr:DPP IV N-terminal domain-containing protein [Bacteroidota bacterium]